MLGHLLDIVSHHQPLGYDEGYCYGIARSCINLCSVSISSLFCARVLPLFTQANAFIKLQYSLFSFLPSGAKTRLSAPMA